MSKDNYKYEIELVDGSVVTNHNNFNSEDVYRVSFVSNKYRRFDVFFKSSEFIFKKRFSRVFIGLSSSVIEKFHCLVTDKFRVYLKDKSGEIVVTDSDAELYL